jgi:hypothetical protein
MNLAPFAKGRLAKPLIEGLREIDGGVNYAGPPLSAWGPCWCAGSSGRVRVRLAMKTSRWAS